MKQGRYGWLVGALFLPLCGLAQYPGWQQQADYTMEIDLDVATRRFAGSSEIRYTNASPDALNRLYIHLFFNAFQPGSSMDVRSQMLPDPDPRVGARIAALPPDEWGQMRVESMQVNGVPVQAMAHEGTVLVVDLARAVQPGETAVVALNWTGRVPRQIRRSGWMNREGVEFSMAQWYPRICAYDQDGWHPNPYIGREFHGDFGRFDVTIRLAPGYVVAGTGENTASNSLETGVWRLQADRVIDHVWAADPDFVRLESTTARGTALEFVHEADSAYRAAWEALPSYTAKAFDCLEALVGPYPYPRYAVIQAGDGGMEYPMATLVTGHRSLKSLVGVTVHELSHSWFQAVLAFNESLHPWMDEGFTSYATEVCFNRLFPDPTSRLHAEAYSSYIELARSGKEEALTTHADRYKTNTAYGVASYSKGEVVLAQLGGVVGTDVRDEALRRFYKDWAFLHPGPSDFARSVERTSGMELDWYFKYFVETTEKVDIAVDQVRFLNDSVQVVLRRNEEIPVPVDLLVVGHDGTRTAYHIPIDLQYGHRPLGPEERLASDWRWPDVTYTLTFPAVGPPQEVVVDPAKWWADVRRENNVWPAPPAEGKAKKKRKK